MRLIKKIAAIMFAFMMVFTLSSNVNAEEPAGTGKITVNDAIDGQTYTVYRILKLDDYDPNVDENGNDTGIYSYKPNGNWDKFLKDPTNKGGLEYIEIDENDYARWKGGDTDTRRAEFAKRALAWAKEHANDTDATTKIDAVNSLPASGNKVEFSGLDLGYYLVDSSVGALCSLTTTNPTISVNEKNEKPVLEKRVNTFTGMYNYCSSSDLVKYTTANFGDVVHFTLTIKNFKGAENLALNDTLEEGLELYKNKFDNDSFTVSMNLVNKDKVDTGVDPSDTTNIIRLTQNNDYTLTTSKVGNKDSFEITFTEEGYKKLEANQNCVLRISYSVVVNKNANINNINTATLTYGDNNSTQDEAYVGSLNIPVLKYTNYGGTEKNLPNAEFGLYKEDSCTTVLKFSKDDTTNVYNYDEHGDVTTTLTSDANGKIQINGLAKGTYYLKEIKAPKGYNLLKNPIKVTITPVVDTTTNKITSEKITVEKDGKTEDVTEVKVENNTGSLLPSTGGAGTTLIYLIGGALVLGSGIVLANKKRAKAK